MSRGFAAIGLVSPKNPTNAGHIMRAATCYGAGAVVIEGARGHGAVANVATDTTKAWRHIPTMLVEDLFSAHPIGSIPVAVDLVDGAVSLIDFVHPQSAFYIFGPEDGTLGKRHLDRCKHRVYVPTDQCMNLSAAVNVVLYDRMAKLARAAQRVAA